MSLVLRICLQYAIRRGVIPSCVHGIGAGLVEGGGESDVPRLEACDGHHDYWSVYSTGNGCTGLERDGILLNVRDRAFEILYGT